MELGDENDANDFVLLVITKNSMFIHKYRYFACKLVLLRVHCAYEMAFKHESTNDTYLEVIA